MPENSTIGPYWDWQTQPIIKPGTPYWGQQVTAGTLQTTSRAQIEKELLQKIAHELHAYVDDKGYDWQSILDWVDEIIEEYYVEPAE